MAILNKVQIDGNAYDICGKSFLGTCTTSYSTAEKTVTCPEFTSDCLVDGARVVVNFSYYNTASYPKLNVNGTGAKAIFYQGSNSYVSTSYYGWNSGRYVPFIYDSTANSSNGAWVMEGYSDYSDSTSSSYNYPDLMGCFCGTGSTSYAKTATLSGFTSTDLVVGTTVFVQFYYTHNSATSATLNISSTGAKPIYRNGKPINNTNANSWVANQTVQFVYDGMYWQMIDLVSLNAISNLNLTADEITKLKTLLSSLTINDQ